MNILYPDRVFTESRQPVPEGVKYSWTWAHDGCRTTLHHTNPTPEQLDRTRKNLKVKEGK